MFTKVPLKGSLKVPKRYTFQYAQVRKNFSTYNLINFWNRLTFPAVPKSATLKKFQGIFQWHFGENFYCRALSLLD